jgi:phosphatidylinositol alpha-1,6-mannosyltransferase
MALPNKMIRVLLLSDSFLPHAGGSREYYNNIYSELVKLSGTEVRILTKKVPGWKEFDLKHKNPRIRIHRLFSPLKSWKIVELPKGIWPFLHTVWHLLLKRPDLIHAGDLYPPGLIALFLKKALGIPYLVYCHGEEITQTDRFRYQPKVRDLIYKNADAVVANADFSRQMLLKMGVSSERIHKLTPGVDADRFKPLAPRGELRTKYGLDGKLVILSVARLVPRKGHRVALEAFAKICHELPSAHYLIVGTGPEESNLRRQLMEAGLDGRVTFAGFVAGEQLPDIHNLADVMLMVNRREENGDLEGFGIVFLEANSAGKPVIGGRSGGAVEAIVDGVTGYLVNPDDSNELAEKLRTLLANKELRETLGGAGARRAREEFKWSTRAEALDKVNKAILNPDDTPPISKATETDSLDDVLSSVTPESSKSKQFAIDQSLMAVRKAGELQIHPQRSGEGT